MNLFEATDYKDFLRAWVEARPGGGRGEYRRMAEILGVSTTLVSQVVNGDKHFSMENANSLCEHLGFNDREADFFLLLVEFARAGTHGYRSRLQKRIDHARAEALKLSQRLRNDRDLSPTETATYYSDWTFTATTNFIACAPTTDVDSLARTLHIPRAAAARVLEFLLDSGILVRGESGLDIGAKHTFLKRESPFVSKHHQNWRMQGFQQMAHVRPSDFFYTSPMSMSAETADLIRRELPNFVEKILKWVGPSPSEIVRCLNIDFFDYTDT